MQSESVGWAKEACLSTPFLITYLITPSLQLPCRLFRILTRQYVVSVGYRGELCVTGHDCFSGYHASKAAILVMQRIVESFLIQA